MFSVYLSMFLYVKDIDCTWNNKRKLRISFVIPLVYTIFANS